MALIKLNSRAIPDSTVVNTDIADGSISTAKLADDAVTGAKLYAENLGRRNLIINGAMNLAQRGTSFTSATTAYHVDRFIDVMNLGAWTVSQSSDAPTGFSKSWKWDCTTANGTLAAGSELIFVTRLEGQDLQHLKYGTSAAESLTLSFWVKSSKTGTYTCEFDQYGDRQITRTYTINSANTWEHKTLTVPGDVAGSIDDDNSAELQLLWWLGAGSNLTSGTLNTSAWAGVTNANRVSSSQVNLADNTANDWYITGVQLEVGDTATPFEHRSFGEELSLCQRYFYNFADGSVDSDAPISVGTYYSTTIIYSGVKLPVTMRVAPTLVTASGTSYYIAFRAADSDPFDSIVLSLSTPDYLEFNGQTNVSGTAGHGCFLRLNNASAKLQLDAEL